MDQIDPYNVPELFRGALRPKNNKKKHKKCIKITLPKMEKRNLLKSARTKTETWEGVGRRLTAVDQWHMGRRPMAHHSSANGPLAQSAIGQWPSGPICHRPMAYGPLAHRPMAYSPSANGLWPIGLWPIGLWPRVIILRSKHKSEKTFYHKASFRHGASEN